MVLKKASTWFFLLIAIILVRYATYNPNPKITSWDNFGYYIILPQTFIHNDPGNTNIAAIDSIRKKYDLSSTLYQLHHNEKTNYNISQYSLGLAIQYFPGFITGHALAKMLNYEADGFSPPYQWSLLCWSLIVIFLSYVLLYRLLIRFFSENTSVFLLSICFFGTNYYTYATGAYGMPHTFLFFLYVVLLLVSHNWSLQPSYKQAIWIGLVLGLMVITRPTEIFAIIIPLCWGAKTIGEMVSKPFLLLRKHYKKILVAVLALLLVASIQMVYWKTYTSEWLYYSYRNPGEGFEFLHPHLVDFLFSFRKGWFLYTPIMLLAVLALLYMVIKKAPNALPFFIFLSITVFVLSSWTCWWYAASLGQRSMIQSYPVYIFGLGFFMQYLQHAQKKANIVFSSVLVLLIGFNLFQCWQYYNGIISYDRMTRAYYFAVFGKTQAPPGADQLLLVDRTVEFRADFPDIEKYNKHYTEKFGLKPDSANVYFIQKTTDNSPRMNIPFNKLTSKEHAWVKVSFDYYKPKNALTNTSSLIVTMMNKKKQGYGWRDVPYTNTDTTTGWKTYTCYYLTPPVRLTTDEFTVFVANYGNDVVKIRDLKVEGYERKQ